MTLFLSIVAISFRIKYTKKKILNKNTISTLNYHVNQVFPSQNQIHVELSRHTSKTREAKTQQIPGIVYQGNKMK